MSTPRNENLSGKPTLGRYTILREVARSNDIVYEAVDPTINRRIAVKELNIAPTLTGQARRERIERFFREGRAAGAMNHPNIVTIFEIGEDNGRFFIAMEFLEGQSLRDRIHTVGVLPLSESVSVITSLCDALSYAHERGVVHRDIKPDNVHILPGGQVKLTDFGIARILGEEQLTMAGQVFGTPSYMSPEQVTGNPLDGRTDQFSLGVLLYEMLTGRKPFTGDTVVTITYRILHEPMPIPAGVPAAVAKVMERALEKRPEMRFASTTEFKNALVSALEQSRTGGFPAQSYAMPGQGAPVYGQAPAAPMTQPYAANPAMHPQQTVMYGAQTQANPMGLNGTPVMAPNATVYPAEDRPAKNNNFGTVAIAAVVLIGVVAGAGFALKGAFTNMKAGQSREQLVQLSKDGLALYNKREYEAAAKLFKQVREAGANADPVTRQNAAANETVCYRMLGQKAQDAGDLPTAEMYFTKALEVSPLDTNAQTELANIRKRRGTSAGTGLPVASGSKSGGGGVSGDNPLASLLQPTPGPSADPATGGNFSLASPSPNGINPGSQSAADFNARNQRSGADAQTLLSKGDAAFQAGRQDEALDLWRQAIAAGPGSPASIQAQQRLAKFGSEGVANPM